MANCSISIRDYFPFVPNKLPPEIEYDADLVSLLSTADLNLSRLVGLGISLPNPYILMLPYIKREAVLSSKIEGTQASLSDLFLYELEQKKPKDDRLGLKEISNYVVAAELTLKEVKEMNWSKNKVDLNLIIYTHKLLMRGVRGGEKSPGSFRVTQNAIVPYPNCPPKDILFTPPPPENVEELLKDLELFMLDNSLKIPLLLRTAMIHYQFETIHPFNDGNGRIGRLLITLYLCQELKIPHPLIYVSAFIERSKDEYYKRLRRVSQMSEWRNWFEYFLTATNHESEVAIKNVERLITLQGVYSDKVRKVKANKHVKTLAESLFKNPFTTAKNASGFLRVSHQTASKTIKTLEGLRILEKYGSAKRNRVYKAVEILEILESV